MALIICLHASDASIRKLKQNQKCIKSDNTLSNNFKHNISHGLAHGF